MIGVASCWRISFRFKSSVVELSIFVVNFVKILEMLSVLVEATDELLEIYEELI